MGLVLVVCVGLTINIHSSRPLTRSVGGATRVFRHGLLRSDGVRLTGGVVGGGRAALGYRGLRGGGASTRTVRRC